MADVAFSCFGLPDDGPGKVSRTEPWDAPVWHRRHFSFKGAKNGYLLLWSFVPLAFLLVRAHGWARTGYYCRKRIFCRGPDENGKDTSVEAGWRCLASFCIEPC